MSEANIAVVGTGDVLVAIKTGVSVNPNFEDAANPDGGASQYLGYKEKRERLSVLLAAATQEENPRLRYQATDPLRDQLLALEREEQLLSDPMCLARQKLKEGGRSGIINYEENTFYYWDGFLNRTLDEAQKLAVELVDMGIAESGALRNPTKDNIIDLSVSNDFLRLMNSSPFKSASLWNRVYPSGSRGEPNPL